MTVSNFERTSRDAHSDSVRSNPNIFSKFGLDRRIVYQKVRYASSAMTDTLPDRLCNDPKSPFFNRELLERGVGIRFNGVERNNVEEYCVSEGWVRVVAGKSVDRHGNPMTVKLKGTVEAYLRTEAAS